LRKIRKRNGDTVKKKMFMMGSLVIVLAFIGGMKFTENLWAA